MPREKHNDTPDLIAHCIGFTCHACKESTLITVHGMEKIESLLVERAFWAIGAAEIAPRIWMCWLCVLDNPRTCEAAKVVRGRMLKIEVLGVATEERQAWRKRE